MTEMIIQEYINRNLLKIFHLENLQKEYSYNEKTNSMKMIFDDFHWVHYQSFADTLHRLLRHKFGKECDKYFGICLRLGKECRHDYQLILTVKFGVSLDTLAGYLRIIDGGNNE